MLDVQTRYLLSQLSATAGARAERKRAEIEAAIRPGRDRAGADRGGPQAGARAAASADRSSGKPHISATAPSFSRIGDPA